MPCPWRPSRGASPIDGWTARKNVRQSSVEARRWRKSRIFKSHFHVAPPHITSHCSAAGPGQHRTPHRSRALSARSGSVARHTRQSPQSRARRITISYHIVHAMAHAVRRQRCHEPPEPHCLYSTQGIACRDISPFGVGVRPARHINLDRTAYLKRISSSGYPRAPGGQ